jgi:CubicO group peptidase (beta-lactamase class C family)
MIAVRLHAQISFTTAVDSLLAREFAEDQPGGVVLVAKNGRVLYEKTFGMAHMELRVPMKDSMVFHIGSLTKQFTAVAILQLYEQHKLDLSETVGKFITGCSAEVGTITIDQLLRHTSGLAEKSASRGEETTSSAIVAGYIKEPTLFRAGTKWQYNNANYHVLGYIVEKISGMQYGEFLDKKIFKPAGMRHSRLADNTTLIFNRPAGYRIEKKGVVNDKIANVDLFFAAGGIVSTTEDLLAWTTALYEGKLLKKETLARAFEPGILSDGKPVQYGYGWHLQDIQGSAAHRHGGSVPGFIAEAVYLPAEQVYVVMLLNAQSRKQVVAISRVIAALAIDKPFPFKERVVDTKLFARLQGVYENSYKETAVITVHENKVYFQRPGGRRYQIRPASEREFFFDEGYVVLEFYIDASGAVTGLNFTRAGMGATVWKKTNKPVSAL